MRVKDAVGKYGEQRAAEHLHESGMLILERNWRCRAGEIDIIARDDGAFVFCEVKTRSSLRFGDPAEAVDARKQERVRTVAQFWLLRHRLVGQPSRFDTVTVLRANDRVDIRHVRGAF